MNDDFLHQFRRAPRPEFARALYERLNERITRPMNPQARFVRRWRPALAAAGALVLLLVAFSFPAVRATAQDFLDLFRVRSFAAIPIDPGRMAQLESALAGGELDFEALIGENVEILQDPGEPVRVASPAEAAQLAGFPVRAPAQLPSVYVPQPRVTVQGAGRLRVIGDTALLQSLLAALNITDVAVPAQLDGAEVLIELPTTVALEYHARAGRSEQLVVVQAPSPEIDLPDGVDLAQLGEIGLRIAGLDADDARRFAQSIDWHSTLLIPIPTNAASFNEVTVQGNRGLLITMSAAPAAMSGSGKDQPLPGRPVSGDPDRAEGGLILLWGEGEMVYAVISSEQESFDLLQVAESLQ